MPNGCIDSCPLEWFSGLSPRMIFSETPIRTVRWLLWSEGYSRRYSMKTIMSWCYDNFRLAWRASTSLALANIIGDEEIRDEAASHTVTHLIFFAM